MLTQVAKILKYMGFQTVCDAAFGFFVLSWFLCRHVYYLAICWSIWAQVPHIMDSGCYESKSGVKISSDGGNDIMKNVMHGYRDSGGVVCFNENIRFGFLGLLLALQVITIIWFGMICRVVYGVISGKGAEDSRSDDEGAEDEDEEVEVQGSTFPVQYDGVSRTPSPSQFQRPLEDEVGVEALHFPRRSSSSRRPYKKSNGRSSGISLPGPVDKKELLGRIGCDKPPESD